MDIVYAIDGSRRVDAAMFQKMKSFVMTSLNSFNISQDGAHVGLVQYGGSTEIRQRLKDGTSRQGTRRNVELLTLVGGPRRMNRALRLVTRELFAKPGERRPFSKRVLILLTTGKNSGEGSGDLPRVALDLRQQGVEVIAVVIGKESDPAEIDAIIAKKANSVNVKDVDKLPFTIGQLEDKIKSPKGK